MIYYHLTIAQYRVRTPVTNWVLTLKRIAIEFFYQSCTYNLILNSIFDNPLTIFPYLVNLHIFLEVPRKLVEVFQQKQLFLPE